MAESTESVAPMPTTPKRRIGLAVAGLLVVVGTATSAVVLTRNSADPTPDACATGPTTQSGVSGTAAEAPDGGSVRVVDAAFTQMSPASPTVSLGAVLENTSGQVAYQVAITFLVSGADGRSAVWPGSGELLRQVVPVVLPGQRIGAGAWTYVRLDKAGRAVTIAGLDVELGSVRWWPAASGSALSAVAGRYQQTNRASGNPESGWLDYTLESRYCEALVFTGTAVIFRDSGGALIGGSFDSENPRARCVPGNTAETVTIFSSLPSGMDGGRTEIYPYCDPALT